jgi:hypothetical protein
MSPTALHGMPVAPRMRSPSPDLARTGARGRSSSAASGGGREPPFTRNVARSNFAQWANQGATRIVTACTREPNPA